MRTARLFPGLWRHFILTIALNFRSRQALVYGYAVPTLFLVAFGSVFRADTPALLGQMGQLLTITLLGGACFGMPTALVAERQQGVWKRYRLLPVGTGWLLGSVMASRVVMVLSSALLQVVLAHVAYHTPFPGPWALCLGSVAAVTVCFLGLGLLVAALADDVPAVQALGQCLFLPMIMIGGVGIPLEALPAWAQRLSAFMPGRYAVGLISGAYCGDLQWRQGAFDLGMLAIIGLCAAVAGVRLFRWDSLGKRQAGAAAWTVLALLGWVGAGAIAAWQGRLLADRPADAGYGAVSRAQIEGIDYASLPGDQEFVSRLSPPLGGGALPERLESLRHSLATWPPGLAEDPSRAVRSLLSVAAIADIAEDYNEGEIARIIFDVLRARYPRAQLESVLAWVVIYPDHGVALCTAPELGLGRSYREEVIRQRIGFYAAKLLGRLEGKLRD